MFKYQVAYTQEPYAYLLMSTAEDIEVSVNGMSKVNAYMKNSVNRIAVEKGDNFIEIWSKNTPLKTYNFIINFDDASNKFYKVDFQDGKSSDFQRQKLVQTSEIENITQKSNTLISFPGFDKNSFYDKYQVSALFKEGYDALLAGKLSEASILLGKDYTNNNSCLSALYFANALKWNGDIGSISRYDYFFGNNSCLNTSAQLEKELDEIKEPFLYVINLKFENDDDSRLIKDLAVKGFWFAQYKMFLFYSKCDNKEALKWLTEMKLNDVAIGYFIHGASFISDAYLPLPRNNVKGVELLLKAAKLGSAEALYFVWQMYYVGQYGQPVNKELANEWMQYSIRLGLSNVLLKVANQLSSTRIEESLMWCKEGIKIGDHQFEASTYYAYYNLNENPKNKTISEESMTQLIKNAEKGNVFAMDFLAIIYWENDYRYVNQNNEKSFFWHKKLADIGIETSLEQAIYMLRKGLGVKKDKDLLNKYEVLLKEKRQK
jgi:TPR repeat protein